MGEFDWAAFNKRRDESRAKLKKEIEDSYFKKVASVISQYKFENVKELGKGTRGTAYDIGNGVVLKITDDFSEARASANIKGKKLKYVNEIYDVFKAPNSYGMSEYLIFQKKLKEIEKEEEVILDWLLFVINVGMDVGETPPTIKKFKEFVKNGDIEIIDNMLPRIGSFLEGYSEKKELVEKIFKKYIDFWLTTKQELASCGVRFHDYHTNNIMKGEGDNYTLIDLGFSRAPNIEIETRLLEYLRKKLGV